MALDILARKQVELKHKQKPHRGRQAKLPQENRETKIGVCCLGNLTAQPRLVTLTRGD